MRKNRIVYLAVVLVTTGLLLWQEEAFYLLLLLAELIMPLLFLWRLSWESGGISMDVKIDATHVLHKQMRMVFQTKAERPLWVAGTLRLQIRGQNIMNGAAKSYQYLIPMLRAERDFAFRFLPVQCGTIRTDVERCEVYDLFGLCRVEVPIKRVSELTIYPKKLPIQMISEENPAGGYAEGSISESQKGRDQSEVFDLREYEMGDDVRAINWKVSSKLDMLMVKEASDNINLDVMVLLDLSVEDQARAGAEKEEDGVQTMNAAISIASAISEDLTAQGVLHYWSMPGGRELLRPVIRNQRMRLDVLGQYLSILFEEHKGAGIKLYKEQQRMLGISKLIYITANEVPEEIRQLHAGTKVTAIEVSMNTDRILTAQRNNCTIVRIPATIDDTQKLLLFY